MSVKKRLIPALVSSARRLGSLAAQVGEALGSEAIPLDLGTFAPVIGPPSDGSEARALITHMVQTALKSQRSLQTIARK